MKLNQKKFILQSQINLINLTNKINNEWMREKITMMEEDIRSRILRKEERRRQVYDRSQIANQSIKK